MCVCVCKRDSCHGVFSQFVLGGTKSGSGPFNIAEEKRLSQTLPF